MDPLAGQPQSARLNKDDLQDRELGAIKEQIANLSSMMRSDMDALASKLAPKDDVSVPADINQSLRSLHSRLDKIERQYEVLAKNQKQMATTFSNAILKLTEKVEKISGGEDSEFSLAHSLEQLISVLESRKFKIVRDNDGNMVRLETV